MSDLDDNGDLPILTESPAVDRLGMGAVVRPGRGPSPRMFASQPEPDIDAELRQSIPLFADYANDTTKVLRVSWLDPATGTWSELGTCPVTAGQDEILLTQGWGRPGSFRVHLIDRNTSRFALNEPVTFVVDPAHRALQRARQHDGGAQAGAGAGAGGHGGGSAELVSLLTKILERDQAAATAERERADRVMREAQEMRDRAAGAVREDTTKFAQTMLDQRQTDQQKVLDATTNAFGVMMTTQQQEAERRAAADRASHELLLARIEASAKAEQARIEAFAAVERERMRADVEAQKLAIAAERDRLREADREREQRLERERVERDKQAEREREREREHYARMADIYKREADPLGSLGGTLTQLATLAKSVGVDVPKMVSTLTGGGGEGAASGGMVETLVGALAPVLTEGIKAWSATQQAAIQAAAGEEGDEDEDSEEGEDDPVVNVRMQDGSTRQMLKSQAEAMMAAAQQARPALPGPSLPPMPPAQPAPQPVPAQVAAPVPPPVALPPWASAATVDPNAPVQPAENPAPAAFTMPLPPNAQVEQPAQVDVAVPDASQHMKAGDLKQARATARQLVARLAAQPEDTWETALFAAVLSSPPLRQYLEVARFEGVLRDIGAFDQTPDHALQILRVAQRSGKLPAQNIWLNGVPR